LRNLTAAAHCLPLRVRRSRSMATRVGVPPFGTTGRGPGLIAPAPHSVKGMDISGFLKIRSCWSGIGLTLPGLDNHGCAARRWGCSPSLPRGWCATARSRRGPSGRLRRARRVRDCALATATSCLCSSRPMVPLAASNFRNNGNVTILTCSRCLPAC
jgi:hypothetical protein